MGAGVVSNGRSKLNRHLTRIVLGASVAYFVCIDAMTPPGESVYAPVFGPVAMRVPWREMSTLTEIALAHARSMVCRPCTLYSCALRVIGPGVNVKVIVAVGVGLGAAVGVAHISPPNHSAGDRIQRV